MNKLNNKWRYFSKVTCRYIFWLLYCMLPSFLFFSADEIRFLLSRFEYWLSIGFIAAFITWVTINTVDNIKK